MEHHQQPPIKALLKNLKRWFAEAPQDQPTTLAATSYLSRNKNLIFWMILKGVLLWLLVRTGTLQSLYKALLQRLPGHDTYPDLYFVAFLLLLMLKVQNFTQKSTRRVVNFFCCLLALLGFGLLYQTGQILTEIVGVILMITGILGSSYHAPKVYKKAEDKLHRLHFANRIAETITNSSEPIKRIAILGEWGSGKTHTLQLIERCLREKPERSYGFSVARPWNVSNEEELHTVIARAIEEAAGFHPDYRPFGWLKKLCAVFGKFGGETSEFVIDLVDYLNGSDNCSEVTELIQRLNDRIKASNKTLVIFIEDMERSEPEVVRRSFAMMDILDEFDNCHFIFAMDHDRIVQAFDGKKEVANGFLDKVIDIQIDLPKISDADLISLCRSKFNEVTASNLLRVWDTISQQLPNTPRRSLRFIEMAKMMENAFLYRFTKDNATIKSLYLLKILYLENPEVHKKLTPGILKLLSDNKEFEWDQDKLATDLKENNLGFSLPKGRDLHLLQMALEFGLDYYWILYDHTSIYKLSDQEFDPIVKEFVANPNNCLEKIMSELPDLKNASDRTSIRQDFYERVYAKLKGSTDPEKTQPIVVALNQNLNVPSTQKFLTPAKATELLKKWLTVISDRKPYKDSQELQNLLQDFTRAVALKMSDVEIYLSLLFPDLVPESNLENKQPSIDHFLTTRKHLENRIYQDLIEAIKGNDLNHPLLDPGSDVASIRRYGIFRNLETWNPASDNFAKLRGLLKLRPEENYQHIWGLMGDVANQLLNDFRNHLRNSPSAPINFIRANPEYLNLLWEMALKSTNPDIDLRGHHGACINLMEELHLDDAATEAFTTAFPLEDGPLPT